MQQNLSVKLIAHTILDSIQYKNLYGDCDQGNLLSSIAAAQCYNPGIYDTDRELVDEDLTQRVASSGHTSILEHGSASFLISGVSRVLSHQLVRHRIASYTQQSQRYTDQSDFEFIVPPTIAKVPEAYEYYLHFMKQTQEGYKTLLDIMERNGYKKKDIQQDVRFILPNACSTQLVMTMNFREFGDFLGKRMCTRAQWEIRRLANEIFGILSQYEPKIFGPNGVFKGPKCLNQGYCDEGRRCCGKMKTLQELIAEVPTTRFSYE